MKHIHCDRNITFALSGRKTLSANLPNEAISVPLGLIARSPYLQHTVKVYIAAHPNPNIIPLPNIDPEGFMFFLDYLSQSRIIFPSGSSLSFRDCIGLLYAHIVGSTLRDPAFQNHIIDELAIRLAATQSHDAQVLEIIFVEQGADESLKRFVVDKMFAVERRMLRLLKGEDKCDAIALSEEKRGKYVRSWNADDDPELNAMSDYYLKRTNQATVKITERHQNSLHASFSPYQGDDIWDFLIDDVSSLHDSPVSLYQQTHCELFASRKSEKPLPALPSGTELSSSAVSPHRLSQTVLPHGPNFARRKRCERRDYIQTEGAAQEHFAQPSQTPSWIQTREIVKECLGRLARAPSGSYRSRFSSVDLYPAETTTTCRQEILPSGNTPCSSRYSSSPLSKHFDRALEDPVLRISCPSISAPGKEETQKASSMSHTHSRSLSRSRPSLIKRKSVPSRGDNWVQQWDRLDTLQVTPGSGQRKDGNREN